MTTTTSTSSPRFRTFDDFVLCLQDDGKPNLSPTKFAQEFDIQIKELAHDAGVHRNSVRSFPNSEALQKYLRNNIRVLSAVNEIQGSIERSIFWMKNSPIPAFDYKTASELIREGRTADVLAYLESIASGFVG